MSWPMALFGSVAVICITVVITSIISVLREPPRRILQDQDQDQIWQGRD